VIVRHPARESDSEQGCGRKRWHRKVPACSLSPEFGVRLDLAKGSFSLYPGWGTRAQSHGQLVQLRKQRAVICAYLVSVTG